VQTWVQQQRLSLSAVVEAFDTFEGLRRPAQPALAAREIRAKHLPAYTVGRRALCPIHMALARAGVVGIHMLIPDVGVEVVEPMPIWRSA
jgi:hypothetical protein